MKKILVIVLTVIVLLGIGYFVNENLEVGTFSEKERMMIADIADLCVAKGIIDKDNPDGDKCVETLCGKEVNEAEGYLQIRKALKECYDYINTPIPLPPVSEFDTKDCGEVDSIIVQCISARTRGASSRAQIEDGERCAITMRGAKADSPEAWFMKRCLREQIMPLLYPYCENEKHDAEQYRVCKEAVDEYVYKRCARNGKYVAFCLKKKEDEKFQGIMDKAVGKWIRFPNMDAARKALESEICEDTSIMEDCDPIDASDYWFIY